MNLTSNSPPTHSSTDQLQYTRTGSILKHETMGKDSNDFIGYSSNNSNSTCREHLSEPDVLKTPNNLSRLIDGCSDVFRMNSKGCFVPPAVRDIKKLRSILDSCSLSDLGYSYESLKSQVFKPESPYYHLAIKSSPAPFVIDVYNSHLFSIVAFVLLRNCVVHMHDHAGMVVLPKLLYGKTRACILDTDSCTLLPVPPLMGLSGRKKGRRQDSGSNSTTDECSDDSFCDEARASLGSATASRRHNSDYKGGDTNPVRRHSGGRATYLEDTVVEDSLNYYGYVSQYTPSAPVPARVLFDGIIEAGIKNDGVSYNHTYSNISSYDDNNINRSINETASRNCALHLTDLVLPTIGNIHEIEPITDIAVLLDVLAPPYGVPSERQCTYFKMLEGRAGDKAMLGIDHEGGPSEFGYLPLLRQF